jgi:Uma2 family endonuclease
MAIQDAAHRKLTYEDYEQIPDDGMRHEILDGEHYVSPSPVRKHQRSVLKLAGRRDEGIKREIYERFVVKEYWLVDPVRQTVLVYRLKGDRFHRAGRFAAAAGDVLTTPLLPGLEIPLAKIFQS